MKSNQLQKTRGMSVLLAALLAATATCAVAQQPLTTPEIDAEAQDLQNKTTRLYQAVPEAEAEDEDAVKAVGVVPLDEEVSITLAAVPSSEDAIRIMIAGEDMTSGVGSSWSTDRMGYRAPIQRALKAAGINYTLVGSRAGGNANKYDTQYEGRTNWRIEDLTKGITKSLTQKNSVLAANPPQIVLLNIGMEDVTDNYKLDSAMTRYAALLSTIRSGFPGTRIAVSTLVDSKNATYQNRLTQFNQSLRQLVSQQAATYNDIMLVEFSGLLSSNIDYDDATHPNDKGYAKLAIAWNKALSTLINHPNAKKLASPPLRIMPLGSSVTSGMGSSSANANAGYRGYLQHYLDQSGISYDMVGSKRRGNRNVVDPDNEGHVGDRIDEVARGATKWLPNNPADIVLLHTGGNDVNQNYRLGEAPARLSALIDLIRAQSPSGVKIIVCTLLDSPVAKYQSRVLDYNAALRNVVAQQAAAHGDVWLSEMQGIIDVRTDLADRLHPNAKGYAKMAVAWAEVLSEIIPGMQAPGAHE